MKTKHEEAQLALPSIILASASPRRAELLGRAGFHFEVVVSKQREPHRRPASVAIELWPVCLAMYKARSVAAQIGDQAKKGPTGVCPVVIGADTIVVLGTRIINKARHVGEARAILQSLSGNIHRVITGVVVLRGDQTEMFTAVATCRMRRLDGQVLSAYLKSGLWRGKAGAYGIQDQADPMVELLDGEMSTVMGLPMERLTRLLARRRAGRLNDDGGQARRLRSTAARARRLLGPKAKIMT